MKKAFLPKLPLQTSPGLVWQGSFFKVLALNGKLVPTKLQRLGRGKAYVNKN
jgi:hypothetical protein